jgi:processing peptidase subunit alpha
LQVGAVNGIKAAALDAGGPNCCVGVFVAGGSAAETPTTSGAAKLLEYLAFSATTNRTTFR